MAEKKLIAQVTVAVEKYADGAIPGIDTPYEVVNVELTPEQILSLNMGGN